MTDLADEYCQRLLRVLLGGLLYLRSSDSQVTVGTSADDNDILRFGIGDLDRRRCDAFHVHACGIRAVRVREGPRTSKPRRR